MAGTRLGPLHVTSSQTHANPVWEVSLSPLGRQEITPGKGQPLVQSFQAMSPNLTPPLCSKACAPSFGLKSKSLLIRSSASIQTK